MNHAIKKQDKMERNNGLTKEHTFSTVLAYNFNTDQACKIIKTVFR